jgi:uncharacterized protein (TIGR03083 family)
VTLSSSEYVAALRREGEALATAALGNLEASVPACPRWTVKDLVSHTGSVHRFWRQIADLEVQDVEAARKIGDAQRTEAARAEAQLDETALVRWFRDGVTGLAEVLEERDGSLPVWSWSAQKNVAFIQRRTAQETAVHRWDAESAGPGAEPIETELARDGIDEFFDIFMPAEEAPLDGGGETIHLHQTDGPGEWILTLEADGVRVARGHSKGDAAVRGPGSDLLLLLWRRVTPDRVEVLGDRAVVDRFLGWMDLE